MARSVTLADIVRKARIYADMKNTKFIDDVDCLDLLNDIYPKLYNELVSSNENYYTSTYNITISSATQSYALPADFFKLLGVEFTSDGGSVYYTLYPTNEAERNLGFSNATLPSGTVRLRYVPAPTTFTSLTQSVDGVAGWDRMLSLLLAIDMLDSEETNSDRLQRKYQEELSFLRYEAERDLGMPSTITDIYKMNVYAQYAWLKYRMYGNNIEFVSTQQLAGTIFS